MWIIQAIDVYVVWALAMCTIALCALAIEGRWCERLRHWWSGKRT